MIVSDELRKCVVFVGLRMADNTFRLAGTSFLLGFPIEGRDDVVRPWAVTARHVIEKIRGKGVAEVFLRVNTKSGQAVWLPSNLEDWRTHPTDSSIDVAIANFELREELDHKLIPYSICGTTAKLKEQAIGLGDEVFITGLFIHHHGSTRNIPIVRVGNIACLAEEKVITKELGEINAYLVEARSIGGLSGSPVFVNLGHTRTIGSTIRMGGGGVLLLGLIHGHYDAKSSDIDTLSDSPNQQESVNMGIAIVVPFTDIEATIRACES